MSALNLTGRGSLSTMLACCATAVAMLVGAGSALAGTNCGPPNSLGGSCFAGRVAVGTAPKW